MHHGSGSSGCILVVALAVLDVKHLYVTLCPHQVLVEYLLLRLTVCCTLLRSPVA